MKRAVDTLNSVQQYDWGKFLRTRLDDIGKGAPLDGIHRGIEEAIELYTQMYKVTIKVLSTATVDIDVLK